MSSVRLRRLTADFTRLSEYLRRHPRLRLIQAEGDPAERYQIEYRIRSLRQTDGELKTIKSHIVEIALPRNYPRTPPQCRMLSPVFHPNIAPHAICVGDHWSAGESLQSIVSRIGEMLAYQSYNVKSPLNGEAARWVQEHEDDLPLDRVSMIIEDDPASSPGEVPTRSSSPQPAASQTAAESTPVFEGTRTPDTTPASRHAEPDDSSAGRTPARQRTTHHRSPAGDATQVSTSDAAGADRPAGQEANTRPDATPNQSSVAVSCPSCTCRYNVPQTMIGRTAECSRCGSEFLLQTASQQADQ